MLLFFFPFLRTLDESIKQCKRLMGAGLKSHFQKLLVKEVKRFWPICLNASSLAPFYQAV